MKYSLFLDDSRYPEDCFEYTHQTVYIDEDWIIVRSYDEFVAAILEKGIPEVISFDHDLADAHYEHQNEIPGVLPYDQYSEKTGYHCAKWLIDYCIDNKLDIPKFIFIHSLNTAGARNIESLFLTYEKIYRGA
jgi:hypothetical protein